LGTVADCKFLVVKPNASAKVIQLTPSPKEVELELAA